MFSQPLLQPGRFGLPACPPQDHQLADRSFLLLCHSFALKISTWVAYELKPEHLNPVAPRPSRFRHHSALAAPATNSGYLHSGFSRGHLAPAADFAWSPQAISATFLLSNAVPQYQSVNAGRWAQLESFVRKIAAASDSLHVFTGSIFDGSPITFIGPGRVAVPTHSFKVILVLHNGRKTMFAAIIPNSARVTEPLAHFSVTVDEVERRTGLDFFAALDDSEEHSLESVPSRPPD